MNNAIVPCLSQSSARANDKHSGHTTHELNDLQPSDWSFDASTSSLDSSLPSTIYNAVHLADDLNGLEDDAALNVEMVQDSETDCQSCLDKDAEIRQLREKIDELQYLGNQTCIFNYLIHLF